MLRELFAILLAALGLLDPLIARAAMALSSKPRRVEQLSAALGRRRSRLT